MVYPRLVRFLASAFDTRYAFVAALGDGERRGALGPLTLWFTRDYGLSVEWAETVIPGDVKELSALECLAALQRVRPDDRGLGVVEQGSFVSVPLLDAEGLVGGHVGLGDPGPSGRFLSVESLRPLARLAEAELETQRRARLSASAKSSPAA